MAKKFVSFRGKTLDYNGLMAEIARWESILEGARRVDYSFGKTPSRGKLPDGTPLENVSTRNRALETLTILKQLQWDV